MKSKNPVLLNITKMGLVEEIMVFYKDRSYDVYDFVDHLYTDYGMELLPDTQEEMKKFLLGFSYIPASKEI